MRKSSTEVILICVLAGLCLSTTVCLAKSIVKEKPSLPKAGVVKDASSYKILPPEFSIAVTPLSIEFRKTGALNVEVTRLGSFAGDVTITLSNLPIGVTTPNLTMTIPAESDTGSYALTATEASKFEAGKMVTIEGTSSLNGKDTTRNATAKVSVMRVMGDFKAVNPGYKWNVTSSDGKLKAAVTGTNPYSVTFQSAPASGSSSWTAIAGSIPFATGGLGGVCFNEASTCGVVMSCGSVLSGQFPDTIYTYTIFWIYFGSSKPVFQQYYVNTSRPAFIMRYITPQLQFSPDGSLALLSAGARGSCKVHLIDIIGARILTTLPANCVIGEVLTYPSAKVYLSGEKTKVDIMVDGATKTFDVP